MKSLNLFLIVLATLFFATFAFAATSDYVYILKLDSTSVYPTEIYPNSEVSLNLTMSNISSLTDATDVIATVNVEPKYFSVIKETDSIGVIKFNQSATMTLRFRVNETTPGGYYSIPVKIEYKRNGEIFTIDSQVSISVMNYDRINLVLTEYPKTKKYLDETVSIKGFVKNEGNTTLKGIFVSSDYGTSKLIPQTEISQFIGDLLPGQQKDYEFVLVIPKSATPGVYDMNISATDIASNRDNEKVSFVVEDVPTLIISSIDKSLETGVTYLAQDSHFSLSVQLENISKSQAKSVNIEIVDKTTDIQGSSIAYVGSIASDDSGAGVFDLYVGPDANTGDQKLTIQINYTDEYDEARSLKKEISLFIDKKAGSGSGWSYAVIVLIIAGVGYYFYRKRSKDAKVKNI